MLTRIIISELAGKPREETERYIYDRDRQDSYIFAVVPDDKHDATYKVGYHDGHGGTWHDVEIDPDHEVELRHDMAIADLERENAQLRAFVERVKKTWEESEPLKPNENIDLYNAAAAFRFGRFGLGAIALLASLDAERE